MAVLVSGGGTNLQALLDAKTRGEMPHCQLSLVVSNKPGAYALERARQAGVETEVLERQRTGGEAETPKEYGKRLVALLQKSGVELVVLAGFLLILDPCVVRAFAGRMVNVHPSLIPAFCGQGMYGLKVHEAALQRGVRLTGATVHLVNEVPDGGRILAQQAVAVEPGDTPETLQQRVMEQAEWVLLPREVEALAAQLEREGQRPLDEAASSRVSSRG